MNRISWAWQLLRLMGPGWVSFRVAYALRQRAGWDAWRTPVTSWDALPVIPSAGAWPLGGRLFVPRSGNADAPLFASWDAHGEDVRAVAARINAGEFQLFEHDWVAPGSPPDWHRNLATGQRAPATGHWSQLDEFGSGDVKLVWELSRFAWVFPLVRAFRRTSDESLAECYWRLVEHWSAHNPPNAGMNWKCGQETSLRVIAWCFGLHGFAATRAQTPERTALLAKMLAASAHRVAANLHYGLSQRNNHGISEAAGLWTVGILLPEFPDAARWREQGRQALESQARSLIYDDGGFAQHSVNYHRLMLEVFLWCIQLGRANGTEFSAELLGRVRSAGKWIEALLDPDTGRVPNWGSNDGAHILPLTNCGYLDYRPVVQATAMVTDRCRVLRPGPWDELAWWLGCAEAGAADCEPRASIAMRQDLPDSGLTVLRAGEARAIVRTARKFRHRPAQSDLQHVDLWFGGANLLRDTGSYRYNSNEPADALFKSVVGHNTVEFDGHDQMPALGRFLYGSWPRGTVRLSPDTPGTVSASYEDWKGCRHERTVTLAPDRCIVMDRLDGFHREAVLRWHLAPDEHWHVDGSTCVGTRTSIHVTAERVTLARLVEGRESLFYNSATPIKVFEIRVPAPSASIQSEIILASVRA